MAVVRLHNFCMDQNQVRVESMVAQDERNIEQLGAVPLEQDARTQGQAIPRQLIGGGEHFVGIDRNEYCRLYRTFSGIELPRERLHAIVLDKDLRRPRPTGRV